MNSTKSTARRIAALIMAVAMIAALALTGCGGNPSENNSEDPVSTVETKHEITIMCGDGTSGSASLKDRTKYTVWNEFQKLLDKEGVKVNFSLMSMDQYKEVIVTKLSTNQGIGDIVSTQEVDSSTVGNLVKNNVLIDIKPAIDQYSNGNIQKYWDENFPTIGASIYNENGQMFQFKNCTKFYLDDKPKRGTGFALSIRRDWRLALNEEVPTTWDELIGLLKKFQDEDANGNGKKDEVITVRTSVFENGLAQCFGLIANEDYYAGGGEAIFNVSNKTGEVVCPWMQPGMKDYLIQMNKLYEDGLLDQNLIGVGMGKIQEYIANNKGSMLYSYILQQWEDMRVIIDGQKQTNGGIYEPLMPIGYGDYEASFWREPSTMFTGGWSISGSAKDLEGAIRFFDVLFTDDYRILCQYGLEGKSYYIDDQNRYCPMTSAMTAERLGKSEEELLSFTMLQKMENEMVGGGSLWGSIAFPTIAINYEYTDQKMSGATEYNEFKINTDIKVQSYENDYNYVAPFATATEAEVDVLIEYELGVLTLSENAISGFIQGKRDISTFEAVLAEMDEYGMQQVAKVYRDRAARYKAALENK